MKRRLLILFFGLATHCGVAVAERRPEDTYADLITLKYTEIAKSRGRSWLSLRIEATNTASFALKDAVIDCEFYGASGTVISTTRRTAYRVFPSKKMVVIAELDFGLMHPEVRRYRCEAGSATKLQQH